MLGNVKKQLWVGVICIAPWLFFSCSSTHKAASAATAKHGVYMDEDKFKALYYYGLKQKMLGNYDDAMGFFKRCLAINPVSPAANFEMSEMLEVLKRPDSAVVYMSRAINGDPTNVWYRYFYAENLQELGRYKDVIKVYQDLIKMHPGNTDFYYKLALAQLQTSEYKEAVETYSALEQKLGSPDEDVAMSKIEILEKIKEYDKAESEIQALIKKDPNTPQYYDMLGNLYEMEGKPDKAFTEYQKMEELYPHDAMVHLSLANYYKNKNQDANAFGELEKAFDEPSLDIETKIRIILGLSTFTNSDSVFSQATTLARKMVAANPTEPTGHAVYAELLLRNHDLQDARTEYRKAISEDSSKFNYWIGLLQLEGTLNDMNALQSESKEAMGLFPDNGQLYYYNGFANMLLKQYDAALTAFKEGVFYVSGDSSMLGLFYSNMGDAAYDTKRYSESDSAYELALKVNPNNDNVLNNYSYYLSVRDTDLSRAERMSKRANELAPDKDSYEDTYAWILFMEGKYSDAKVWENKALTDGGGRDATILEHFGDIQYKLGDKDSAVEYWIKAKSHSGISDLLDRKIKDKTYYQK